MIFKPFDVNKTSLLSESGEFNSYTGFKARLTLNFDINKISLLLNHIKIVMANGDDFRYNYILTYLSHIIKFPWKKTKIMLVFYSDSQQVGKGTLAEFLLNYIFGSNLAVKTASLETVAGRFNGITQNKLFVCIDDVSACDKFNENLWDKLKSAITDPIQTIERKGIEAREVVDYSNFMLLSNHSQRVEKHDARTAVFKVSECKIGDRAYFNNLHSSFNSECGDNFYTFLYNYRTDIELRNIPQTEEREDMKLISAEQPVKFFMQIKSGDFTLDSTLIMTKEICNVNRQMISVDDLFLQFCSWVVASSEKSIYTKIKFGKYAKIELGKSSDVRILTKIHKCFDVTDLMNVINE